MSTVKKKPAVGDAVMNEDGTVTLTFKRPHGAPRAGVVIILSGTPHRVEKIKNKFMLVVRKMEQPKPPTLAERVKERFGRVFRPRPKAGA